MSSVRMLKSSAERDSVVMNIRPHDDFVNLGGSMTAVLQDLEYRLEGQVLDA